MFCNDDRFEISARVYATRGFSSWMIVNNLMKTKKWPFNIITKYKVICENYNDKQQNPRIIIQLLSNNFPCRQM